MKSSVKNIFFTIGKFLSFIYPVYVHRKCALLLKNITNKIYLGWLSGTFKELEKNSVIARPNILIGEKYISIKENVYIDKNAVLCAWDSHGNNQFFNPTIVIGKNTCIGEYSHISAIDKIEIGENVLTGRWVTIVDNNHGDSDFEMIKIAPTQRPLYSKGAVKIGNNVWIGDKVSILGGVTIGNNSIIGANTVVTKDVPTDCLAVGNPMRLIELFEK